MSGGGVKGICMLGALSKIDISKVRFIAGSSAGGLIAALLCVLSPFEALQVIRGAPCTITDSVDLENLLIHFGLASQQSLLFSLSRVFYEKIKNNNPTFKDILDKTGYSLTITGSNVTQKRCEYFSASNTPSMSVLKAVEITITIPFVFRRVIYNDDVYADGSIMDMYPSSVFKGSACAKTLKVYCVSENSVEIDDIVQYAVNLISCALESQKPDVDNDTILLPDVAFSVLSNLSTENIDDLYNIGASAAEQFNKKNA